MSVERAKYKAKLVSSTQENRCLRGRMSELQNKNIDLESENASLRASGARNQNRHHKRNRLLWCVLITFLMIGLGVGYQSDSGTPLFSVSFIERIFALEF
jgi:hypothetical protein